MQIPINLSSPTPTTGPVVGVLVSRDLIFTTKITGTARALGHSFAVAGNSALALKTIEEAKPKVILLDLAAGEITNPDAIRSYQQAAGSNTPIVAFGSHVETQALDAARSAGCREVMPRSKFSTELAQIIQRYCDAPTQSQN